MPPEVVDRLLDRARRAPSAGHTQGWALPGAGGPRADPPVLVDRRRPGLAGPTGPPRRAPGAGAGHPVLQQPGLPRPLRPARQSGTPAWPVEAAWPAPYWLIDTAFATMLLLLGAVEEGLGALFFRTPWRSGPAARRVRRARRLGADRRGRPRLAGAVGGRDPAARPPTATCGRSRRGACTAAAGRTPARRAAAPLRPPARLARPATSAGRTSLIESRTTAPARSSKGWAGR